MKNLSRFAQGIARSVAAACWLGLALALQAQNTVTFQVDMSIKAAEGVFNRASDAVTVHGSFDGWTAAVPLTPDANNPDLYLGSITVSSAIGSNVEYKFVYNNGSDQWESRANRSFTLAGGAQTLPVVYYDDDSVISILTTTPVTFRVNMGVKIAEGFFDPAQHTVSARGSFNDWKGGFDLAPSAADTNIYEGTIEITALSGSTINYKFVVNNGSDQWEGDPNRGFALATTAQTLPTEYFDRDTVISLQIKAAVAFQLDLSVQIAAGNFDRSVDEAWVRGNRMGWGNPASGFQLFEDALRPGVFTNIYTMENELTGTTFEYKHTIWHTLSAATAWEDGNNKTLSFSGNEPTNAQGYHQISVAKTYFNNLGPSDILTADTLVTFRVDMSAAQNSGGSAFDPGTQGVWLNGNFIPWWTWNSAPEEFKMVDDGSGGDSAAGDKIYTLQRTLPRGTNTRVEYKYGIDSGDNEAGFGSNHVRYVRAVGSYTMPIDVFGTMTAEPEVGALSIALSGGQANLTWNGRPGVRLQSSPTAAGATWTDVAGSDGASSKSVTLGSGAQFFRLAK